MHSDSRYRDLKAVSFFGFNSGQSQDRLVDMLLRSQLRVVDMSDFSCSIYYVCDSRWNQYTGRTEKLSDLRPDIRKQDELKAVVRLESGVRIDIIGANPDDGRS